MLGNPADGVRDLPDVSMFAADRSLGVTLTSFASPIPSNGGTPCNGTASGWSAGWGGTSFALADLGRHPSADQPVHRVAQGNPNPVLYKLAAAEYGASGSSACNSSNGNAVAGSCIFYDVTLGDMVVDCTSGTHQLLCSGPAPMA